MKKNLLLMLFLLISSLLFSNEGAVYSHRYFKELNFYYLEKDSNFLNSSISFFNENLPISKQRELMLTSFYIALFDDQPYMKKSFQRNLRNIKSHRNIIEDALNKNLDNFLKDEEPSPTWIDIYWHFFYATGNEEYLDRVICLLKYETNRENIVLYLTGAAAKWSLAYHIQEHPKVRNYIKSLKIYPELFTLNLEEYKAETKVIVKEEHSKGTW